MPEEVIDYRRTPCDLCPWRRDADLAKFTSGDREKLIACNGTPGNEAPMQARMLSCHPDQPGTRHAMRLCKGWLVVVGEHHLQVRMHRIAGRLPDDAVAPVDGGPALYSSLAEMLAHWPSEDQDTEAVSPPEPRASARLRRRSS
ncbi:DUF6283 family protein [Allokutzneria multivorans]|uniref:DUF6283 family protein n=1 Tax=Allokutzneria multivorans TaxID=1142134 RepID=UPI0031E6CA0F